VEGFRQVWSRATPVSPAKYSLAPTVRRRVLDYIKANLTVELSLSDLAAVAGLSPYHLARCFRQEVGTPPHRYVRDRRLEQACQLLAQTNLPIAEIAAGCGFARQSHLTTAFRKSLGITSGQYTGQTVPDGHLHTAHPPQPRRRLQRARGCRSPNSSAPVSTTERVSRANVAF
jgi:AraC-like DNA-binding protein